MSEDHTPDITRGPWFVGEYSNDYYHSGYPIGTTPGASDVVFYGIEEIGNAHLIAASRELLDDFCDVRTHVVMLIAIIEASSIKLSAAEAEKVARIRTIAHSSMPSIQKALGNYPKEDVIANP